VGLRDYLNQVLAHCNDDQCQLLARFLRVNRHLRNGIVSASTSRSHRSAVWREVADAAPGTHPPSSSPLHTRGDGPRDSPRDDPIPLPNGTTVGTASVGREVVAGVPHSSLRSKGVCAASENRGLERAEHARGHQHHELCESTDSCLALPAVWSVDAVSGAWSDPAAQVSGKRQQPAPQRRSPGGGSLRGAGVAAAAAGRKQLLEHSKKAGVGLFFVQGIDGGECVVDEVIVGSAAARDGRILVGDVLAAVDGQSVAGMSLTHVRALIVGDAGTIVSLDVIRGGVKLAPVRLHRAVAQPLHLEGAMHSADLGASAEEVHQCGEEQPCDADTPPSHGALRLETSGDGGAVKVRALCAFPAQKEHELELEFGEVVTVTRQHESGWWEGVAVRGGRRGWFPSNHVERLLEGRLLGGVATATPSSESMTSGQSLSYRSTVLANEMSGNSTGLSQDASPRTPEHLADMSVEDVCEWLRALELGEYAEVFRANKIDGELLIEMQESELLEDFGMTNKYHRRRLFNRLPARGSR